LFRIHKYILIVFCFIAAISGAEAQDCDLKKQLKELNEAVGEGKVKAMIRLYTQMGKNPACDQGKKNELGLYLIKIFRQAGSNALEAKLLLVDAINLGHSVETVQEKLQKLHQAKSLIAADCNDSLCRDVQMDIIINLGYSCNSALRYDSVVYYSLRAEELIPNAPRVELSVKAYLLCVGAYMIQNKLDKSLDAARNAYKFAQQINGPNKIHLMAASLENLSYQYFINKHPDSALYYTEIALNDPNLVEDMKFKQGIFARRGYVFYEKGDYVKYLEATESALKYAKELGDEAILSASYQQYANALDRNKRYADALNAANESLRLSLKLSLSEIATEALRVKMAVLEQTGNYRNALEAYKFFYHLRDSLTQIRNEAASEKMRLEFEAEKKDLDIQKLGNEKLLAEKKRQNQFVLFLAAVLLLLIVLLFFWMRQRRKTLEKQLLEKELNAEHNRIGQMLAEQKNKIANAELETLNRERNKISEVLSHSILGTAKPLLDDVKQLRLMGLDSSAHSAAISLEEKIQILNNKIAALTAELVPVETEPESNFCDDLRVFVGNFFKGKNHTIKLRFADESTLNTIHSDKKVLVYKILQEVLSNVLKHAHSNIVTIDVYTNSDWLNISVEDNGKGFVTENFKPGKGLSGLKALIAGQGGIFTMKSTPDIGTKISAVVPLPQS
jgi:signal transduction histidine kinase